MLDFFAAFTTRIQFQFSAARDCLVKALVLAFCLAVSAGAFAQSASPTETAQAPVSPPQEAGTSNSAASTQQVPHVSTTVVVRGDVKDDYLPDTVTVGTIDGAALMDTPLSATVMTRDLLNDQITRLLSDVTKNDASVGDDYVPVGYYGVYMIRGFPLDLATGLEVNGMTIAGEQDVPLENKQSVEFLKGIAGVESGVASAGGLIDYVTKRPAIVKAVDLSTDQRGTAYGAADLGRFFGSRKQVGARVNLAGERIVTYMNDTNGWRAMGAGAADWKINSNAILKGDFEYQHKAERDGSGYQLLGGTTVPDINQIYRSTMLGDQPWGPPDTYDTFNTGARFDYTLSKNWKAFAAASYSHSLIQDNVIYAYGSSLDASGNANCPGAPNAVAYFFCPDGTYGIYDYRDPGELRIDAEAEAMLIGHLKTGAITQDLAFGGELFLRSVQLPGYYSFANPSTTTIADGAVYDYVGPENIYDPITPVALGTPDSLEYPLQSAGPRRLDENNHQSSAILQDRLHLPGRIQLIAGGRFDSLRDHNYSLADTSPCTVSAVPGPANDPCPTTYDAPNPPVYSVPTLPTISDKILWLPQYAVTFNPLKDLTLYSNYGVLLSLGPQAPWWAGGYFLSPFYTRQVEVGAKYEPGQRILLTTSFFHMRAPFFYPKLILQAPDRFCTASDLNVSGTLCFVSEGRETHNGVELNAEGKAASWLRLTASAMAISALSTDTGTPDDDRKQVLNVPRLHTTFFADVLLPHVRGLYLLPGWSYTGRKAAMSGELEDVPGYQGSTPDLQVSVPSYSLFNLGARYTPGGDQGQVTFRIYANNIADKRYWSDTGASYGDTFIWLGAPTTVRLSAHYTF
jgi:iron complex outermembrane receptor protein